MPTYQYACTECGHAFEAVQSFIDDALTACPQCEGRLRKVFSSVGIVFKGSGFYRNDSREKDNAGTKADSKPDAKADSKPDAKADLKTDTKPAVKTESTPAKSGTESSSGSSAAGSTSGRSSTEGSAA